MPSLLRIDPLGVFNFYLTLIDTSNVVGTLITMALNYKVAGFSECSGLDATVEVFDIKEGGVNDHVFKFPTRASHGNITLKAELLVEDAARFAPIEPLPDEPRRAAE